MYAIAKGNYQIQTAMENYVKVKSRYERLGYIMPDQLLGFLELEGMNSIIVHKGAQTTQSTYLKKLEDKIQAVTETLSPITSLPSALTNSQAFNVLTQITKNTSIYLLKDHPLIKILNIAIIIYEYKYGKKKFNKILLM